MAKGDKVRVSEAYRERASLLHYARSPADLTLRLESLRQNDTGFYRCEVQQGLEDADDVAHVQVKGAAPEPVKYSILKSRTKACIIDYMGFQNCGSLQTATVKPMFVAYH